MNKPWRTDFMYKNYEIPNPEFFDIEIDNTSLSI